MDSDDDGMVHHAVYDSGGEDRIAEVIAEFLEVDICGDQRRPFAVPTIYDFEKQGGVPCILLFHPVKAYFIDEEDIRGGILFELFVKAVIGPACHQLSEHVGCGSIPAAVQFRTAYEKQCLGDVAFPCARVPCDHEPLLPPYEVQLRNLHHLGLVCPGLESEVELRKKFPIGEP